MREPLRPLAPSSSRHVLVIPEIDALLDGHLAFGNFPAPEADRLIASFVAGWLVTASRKITKRKPDVEQIVGEDEVWALCPRRPPPGWRILGRFFDPGVFIGLRAFDKHWLARNYKTGSALVIEDWKEIFGDKEPYRAQSIDLYVTGLVRDVDETE